MIAVQDSGSGLDKVVVDSNTNDTISIPNFTVGTTTLQTVTATKIDQSESATVTITATDVAGNSTTCDPADLTIKDIGIRGERTLTHISSTEHYIQLVNDGKSGVERVDLLVNGKLFKTVVPTFNAENLDVRLAMKAGNNNKITVWAYGPKGSTVFVLVHD